MDEKAAIAHMHVYLVQQLYDIKELVDLESLKIILSLDYFFSKFSAIMKTGTQIPGKFGLIPPDKKRER